MGEGLERTLSEDVGLCGRCELDLRGSSGTWTAPVQARVSSRLPLVRHSLSLSTFPQGHGCKASSYELDYFLRCPGNPEGFFQRQE